MKKEKQAPKLTGFTVLSDYALTNEYAKSTFDNREDALAEAKKRVGQRYNDETYYVCEYKAVESVVERQREDNFIVYAL